MIKSGILTFALLTSSANAFEREVVLCKDALIGLTSLATPAGANSRQFYEGKVDVYGVETSEPACCTAGVAVVLPDVNSEVGDKKCVAVLHQNGIDVENALASYDASRGLLIEMNTTEYIDGTNVRAGEPLKLRVNLKNSTVTLEE